MICLMDHRTFLKSLRKEDRLRLTETSDRAGLLHLAGHLAVIACLGGLVATEVPGWPVLMVPLGIAVIFLFTLQHETCHLTPFRSPWLNRWVSAFCGAVILLPPVWFRFFHMAHHRHTHDPDKDPELEGAKPETLRDWVWHVSGARGWISQVRTILRNAAGGCRDPYIP